MNRNPNANQDDRERNPRRYPGGRVNHPNTRIDACEYCGRSGRDEAFKQPAHTDQIFEILNEGPNGSRNFHRDVQFCLSCLGWAKQQFKLRKNALKRAQNSQTSTTVTTVTPTSSGDTMEEDISQLSSECQESLSSPSSLLALQPMSVIVANPIADQNLSSSPMESEMVYQPLYEDISESDDTYQERTNRIIETMNDTQDFLQRVGAEVQMDQLPDLGNRPLSPLELVPNIASIEPITEAVGTPVGELQITPPEEFADDSVTGFYQNPTIQSASRRGNDSQIEGSQGGSSRGIGSQQGIVQGAQQGAEQGAQGQQIQRRGFVYQHIEEDTLDDDAPGQFFDC